MGLMLYLVLALLSTGFYLYYDTEFADTRVRTAANMFLTAAIFSWLGVALCIVKAVVKNQDRIGNFVGQY